MSGGSIATDARGLGELDGYEGALGGWTGAPF